jgi:uncharacterized protein (DUF2147 family)
MPRAIVLIALCFLPLLSKAQNPDRILGFWRNEANDKVIEIYKKDGLYNGRIQWLRYAKNPDGSVLRDIYNNDEIKRSRVLIGIDLLIGFRYDADDDEWDDGEIYSENSGNTYNGKLSIASDGSLHVTGYYGILWFLGRTKVWYRK